MDNDICGVVVCVRNTAISIEIFDAIGEGKDGHVEVRLNVVAIPVKYINHSEPIAKETLLK